MNIYTLTAIQSPSTERFNSRCWGYYFKLEQARKAAKYDYGAMNDCMYDYLVIERFKPGVLTCGTFVDWYKYDLGWKKIKMPEQFKGLINFGIG